MGTARRRAVATFVVVGSLATLSRAGGTLLVEHTTAHPGQFGWNVSAIGDVNKDGVSDYAVGARGAGYVTVYSGADRSFLYDFQGTGFFGWSIAPYADVNDDGRADFLVGAPTLAGPAAVPGHVRVCSGLDGSEIRRVTGTSANERFGAAVAAVGDVNGDAVPDFAVGAPGGTGISAGAVHVYSGQDGSEFTALARTGSTFRDNLGASVAGLGDVNGDGVPDFAVGAPGADRGNTGSGVTYGRVLWISGKDGALLGSIDGKARFGIFGEAISACGDQDGDGITDLLVGARGVSGVGQATIFSSRSGRKLFSVKGITPHGNFGIGVAGLDDFDGDGRAEIAVGAELDGSGDVVVISPGKKRVYFLHRGGPGDLVGDFLARAGDLDGDGKTELLVGAWGADRARVFKIDTTPLPLPAKSSEVVNLLPPEGTTSPARGTVKLSVKGVVFSVTVSAKKLPVAPGKSYTVFLEDGVATGTFFSIGTLTVTPAGKGKLLLVAQYLPPPQLQVATLADLSGRRAELRDGATVVLTGTIP
jgi:FG-GAP repeat protein